MKQIQIIKNMKMNLEVPQQALKAKQQHKMRLKTSPSSNYSPQTDLRPADGQIVSFQSHSYPFLNMASSPVTALKTTINFTITPQVLEKIVSVSHPNLIAIRKILKNSPKDHHIPTSLGTHYSFFYQPVHFSLTHLAEHPNEHPQLHSLLLTINIRPVLTSLAHYLQQAGISYSLKPQDIGMSLEGDIKVFIPPTSIFAPQNLSNMSRSAVGMADWWQQWIKILTSNTFRKEKKVLQLQPPKLSLNDDFSLDEQSVRDSTLQKELDNLLGEDNDDEVQSSVEIINTNAKCLLKESMSSVSKVGSLQIQKINKINEEIKVIRNKINEKKKPQPEPAKQSFGKLKNNGRLVESSMKIQPPKQEYYRQPMKKKEAIQQNINCINIYNHNNHLPPNSYNNRFNTLPNFIQPHISNYQTYPDPEIYGYYDDNYSQDTYDIEFQAQFDPTSGNPTRKSTPFRHTIFTPDRELSEYQCPKKTKEQKYNQLNAKQHVNQVCNKNYTESAGPLQFKALVSKFMKTQEKIENEQKQFKKDHSISGYGKNRRSVSMEKGVKKALKAPKVESSCEIDNPNIKRNYSQNMFSISTRLNNTCESHNPIEQKVRKALQKTKNAIALLNRVKQNKNTAKSGSVQ